MPKPIIAVTMGDPGGIGPEIIAKTFKWFKFSKKFVYLIIGAQAPFEILRKKFNLSFPCRPISSWSPKALGSDEINFIDITASAEKIYRLLQPQSNFKEGNGFDSGKITLRNAVMTQVTLELAAQYAVRGYIQGMVTAPLHKTSMRLLDSDFHGHTEFLAHAAKVKKFAMMFVGPRLKVTLVTIHEPISKISSLIRTPLIVEKIQLTDQFLKKQFKINKPKIAVCALNPHGKETGTEDEKEIRPAVLQARKLKIDALGPLSADQVFYDAYEGRFDAVISMYHDQGLAPFKMIAFREGVNVTLGLPFVRTSPDHGTAFDIAYQNKADAASFLSSLKLAEHLVLKS